MATFGPIRLTSVSRTLIDCAREWPLEPAVVAMDAALLARRTTTADLRRCLSTARRWRALDIRVVPVADADLGRRWPVTETRLRELLGRPGPAVRRFTAVARDRGRLRTG